MNALNTLYFEFFRYLSRKTNEKRKKIKFTGYRGFDKIKIIFSCNLKNNNQKHLKLSPMANTVFYK